MGWAKEARALGPATRTVYLRGSEDGAAALPIGAALGSAPRSCFRRKMIL